jgi:hypothetical protein
MVLVPTTSFDEDETLGIPNLVYVQYWSKTMFEAHIVCGPIDVLEGRHNFSELPLHDLEQWQDILEMR